MSVEITAYKCPQNHPCPAVRVCPVNALMQDRYEAPRVDEKLCMDCGNCVAVCAMRAIQLKVKV
ncbi:4Fe-4S binding protein [bacterium]|nr:4Fe-4S binding protein [bacterium]